MRLAILEEDDSQTTYLINILSDIRLNEETLHCESFTSGKKLRSSLRQETYDLVIMDWTAADIDGIDVLEWLRNFQRSQVPVMMLTSHGSEQDIARALAIGADDYVVKPLRPMEFKARVGRLLARRATPASSQMVFGEWTFDRSNTTATIRTEKINRQIILTEREFRLAVALFQHLGSPLSRSHLLEYSGVNGEDTHSRALDSHVYRLRGKLFLEKTHNIRLQTIYGHGYRLERVT